MHIPVLWGVIDDEDLDLMKDGDYGVMTVESESDSRNKKSLLCLLL